jgi:micrococcal nuclease
MATCQSMGRGRTNNVVRGGFRRRVGGKWTKPADFDRRTANAAARTTPSWAKYGALWLGAVLVGGAYGAGAFDGLPSQRAQIASLKGIRASFAFCHMGGGYSCVVDGDTIWLQGQKIRIADIDTPETHDFQCPSEKKLGDRATQRLRQLLNNGAVTLQPIDRDEDRYGRKLRIVLVDGTSVGDTLVEEGLARWYEGGRRPWC